MENKKLNRAVWLFHKEEGRYTYTLDKSKTYKVIKVIPYKECDDRQDHLIIRDYAGVVKEVPNNECIALPYDKTTIEDEAQRVANYLATNGLYFEDVYMGCSGCKGNEQDMVCVSISWGDWKHDHGYCDSLMEYIGYSCDDEIVDEENGSDTYSATHYYTEVETEEKK